MTINNKDYALMLHKNKIQQMQYPIFYYLNMATTHQQSQHHTMEKSLLHDP